MLEDPNITALQGSCVGPCDVTFDVVYYTGGPMAGEAALQVTQVAPAAGDLPRYTLARPMPIGLDPRIRTNDPESFFATLRDSVKKRPSMLFRQQSGS